MGLILMGHTAIATVERAFTADLAGATPARGTTPAASLSATPRVGAEQMAYSAPPTQEDQYWGRAAGGTDEDYCWRRLSDKWSQKDVIPSTYLEIHNQCYEAYNANPLANYIIEITRTRRGIVCGSRTLCGAGGAFGDVG